MTSVAVLLAEPDRATSAGLRLALERGGLEVLGEVEDADSAATIAADRHAQACIVGSTLHGGAVAAVRLLAERSPATQCIVLAARSSPAEFLASIRAGARGYLASGMGAARLADVVRAVAVGEVAVPRRFTSTLVDELQGRDRVRDHVAAGARSPLTGREWEVLRMLGDERSTAQMATELGISEVTVRRHVSTLLRKLGVEDRSSAAALLRSPS